MYKGKFDAKARGNAPAPASLPPREKAVEKKLPAEQESLREQPVPDAKTLFREPAVSAPQEAPQDAAQELPREVPADAVPVTHTEESPDVSAEAPVPESGKPEKKAKKPAKKAEKK